MFDAVHYLSETIDNNFMVPFIAVSYILFVKFFGPQLMKNKAPFPWVKKITPIYNIVQVLCNIGLIYFACKTDNFIREGWSNLTGNLEYSDKFKYDYKIIGLLWCWLKISDLLDTVFFILSKKFSHVSFLHVYHHSTTMFLAFISSKYLVVSQAVAYAGVNCLVHVAMYFYYFLTSVGYQPRWKKFITTFQIIQFFTFFFSTIVLIFFQTRAECFYYSVFVIAQFIMYIYLFSVFYISSYIKRKME